MIADHAIVEREGFKVPLIGVPADAVLETCDCCGDIIGLTDAVVGDGGVYCRRCASTDADPSADPSRKPIPDSPRFDNGQRKGA
jgi:hypothetical protein